MMHARLVKQMKLNLTQFLEPMLQQDSTEAWVTTSLWSSHRTVLCSTRASTQHMKQLVGI